MSPVTLRVPRVGVVRAHEHLAVGHDRVPVRGRAQLGLPADVLFVVMSHDAGRPVIGEDMLRSGVPPHIGQSCDASGTAVHASRTSATWRVMSR